MHSFGSVLRHPRMLMLLYVACFLVAAAVWLFGVRQAGVLDDNLGRGTGTGMGLLTIAAPVLALASWVLCQRPGWSRYIGQYTRLVADILLTTVVLLLFFVHVDLDPFAFAYRAGALAVLGACSIFLAWTVAADVLLIRSSRDQIRQEIAGVSDQ